MNVQIKPLAWEWEDFRSVWKAQSVLGEYTVWTIQGYTCFKRPEWDAGKGCGAKDEDGFAAAQADFNARILSAIVSSPVSAEVTVTDELVAAAMLDAWNDICSDTGCHPLDVEQVGRKRLEFHPAHWARFTAQRLIAALNGGRENG